jgi:dolichol-phosphate mannosyltransferase
VVDDQSSDDTAAIAPGRRTGDRRAPHSPTAGPARRGRCSRASRLRPPTGWSPRRRRPTRSGLPTALVARATGDRLDLLTVGGRFECPTTGSRWLHPAMLTTLVYRFGPPGTDGVRPERTMANGQCMDRATGPVPGCRRDGAGARRGRRGRRARPTAGDRWGWRVGFLDASDLLTVRMFESFTDAWPGGGARSPCPASSHAAPAVRSGGRRARPGAPAPATAPGARRRRRRRAAALGSAPWPARGAPTTATTPRTG